MRHALQLQTQILLREFYEVVAKGDQRKAARTDAQQHASIKSAD